MKKILLSLILILALLLSFAACDLEGKDKDDDDDKDDEKEEVVYDEATKENINSVVDSINQGVNFDAFLSGGDNITVNGEQIDIGAIMDQTKDAAAQVLMTLTVMDSEANIYVGMKDSTVCVMTETPNGTTEAWSFLEDDMKVVTVTNGEYGYDAEVVADLSEYFSMMDTTLPESDPQTEEILDIIGGIEFPKITKKDITYKDGKYYVSNDYLIELVGVVLDAAYEYSANMEDSFDQEYDYDYDEDYDYEEEVTMTPEDIKSMAKEYMKHLNVNFYFYMENEAVTGFGISVKPSKVMALQYVGYENVEFLIDVNKANFEIKAVVSSEDAILIDCKIGSKAEFDAEGNFTKYILEADCTLPYSDYAEVSHNEEIVISGMQRMYAGITLDAANLASGQGEWLNLKWTYKTSNITASVWDDDAFNYSYSKEYTDYYADMVPEFDFEIAYEADSYTVHAIVNSDGEKTAIDAACNMDHNGDVISGDMTMTLEVNGEELTFDAEFVGDMTSAPDFPFIPSGVQFAREQAIAEYDYYY